MTARQAFKANIRNLLHERGLTQAELARRCGRDVDTVNAWASGRRIPRLNSTYDIAKALGVTVNDLLKGANG